MRWKRRGRSKQNVFVSQAGLVTNLTNRTFWVTAFSRNWFSTPLETPPPCFKRNTSPELSKKVDCSFCFSIDRCMHARTVCVCRVRYVIDEFLPQPYRMCVFVFFGFVELYFCAISQYTVNAWYLPDDVGGAEFPRPVTQQTVSFSFRIRIAFAFWGKW